MKRKFTAGPWSVEKELSTCNRLPSFGIQAEVGGLLAEVYLDDEVESRANAQLMALAPDLFEAGVAAVKVLMDLTARQELPSPVHVEIFKAVAILTEAISRAVPK